jgi:hypothetical protein
MVRVAAWTGGLFGAGAMICRMYPTSWIEPVVLLALGATLLFVSARTGHVASAAPRRLSVVARARRAIAAKEAPAA